MGGPSFPWLVKLLATGLVAVVVFWGQQAARTLARSELGWGVYATVLVTGAVVVFCYAVVLFSRTEVCTSHIRQRGPWPTEVALADITQAKLIDLPGLRWLIAPRLMVRVKGWGAYTFYAAEPLVIERFKALGLGQLPRRPTV